MSSMLTLRQITFSQGNKTLIKDGSVTIYEKQKVGLVGFNGCGKSSLFSLILNQLTLDKGEFFLNASTRISHLSQNIPDSQEEAINFVLGGDEEYIALQKRLLIAEQKDDHHEVLKCHELLNQTHGYSKPAQAASIMSGLGFDSSVQKNPLTSFSGGYRMRLSLARCLMKPADLLLLDEPTNHLDMEAIFWLEKWIKQLSSTVILISHDREFLDSCVTHILHVDNQDLHFYTGNYSHFEKIRAEKLALNQKAFEKQQQKIGHMLAFVNRFKAKASKAKQAQSRLKAIEKMALITQAQTDSPFSFDFYPISSIQKSLIRCEELRAGYNPEQPVLNKINLIINPGDRIALLGPNGEGKSTFIKTLTQSISPLGGNLEYANHLKIGYYAQHQLEELNSNLSPLETIQQLSPQEREQTIRDFIGGFNFIGDAAVKPIHYFSGGEKARLALAKLVWQKPNLLLLDEPTNHLDLGMRAAIEIALQSYEGALVLISHDRHLLKTTVDDYYLVYQKSVQPFKGNLDDYYDWLAKREDITASKKIEASNYREKKSLQNRLKKLEQILLELKESESIIEIELSDVSLYESARQHQLQTLLNQQKALHRKTAEAEEEWLLIMGELEN